MPDIQVRSVEGSLGLYNYVTVHIVQYLNLGNCVVYYVMKSDIDCICHPRIIKFTPPLFNKVIACTTPGKWVTIYICYGYRYANFGTVLTVWHFLFFVLLPFYKNTAIECVWYYPIMDFSQGHYTFPVNTTGERFPREGVCVCSDMYSLNS